MSETGGILALDLSLKTGWAYGGVRATAPRVGLWRLNGGLLDMGQAWVDLQNKVEDFAAVSQPSLIVYALPYAKIQTTARLGLGLAAHAESSAWRLSIQVREIPEGTARKGVLGRGGFAERDDQKRIIKGSARKNAKAASMAWCEGKGWPVRDDNESDACVIWEFARRFVLSRQQWNQLI
jgi:hypothetical protein